jgi:hypothetical protein
MTPAEVLTQCELAGLALAVLIDGNLSVSPATALTPELRAALREHKAAILRLIHPFINEQGDLVIPFRSAPKYHYWNGGQSTLATLRELNAPAELIRRHAPPELDFYYQYEKESYATAIAASHR